MINGYRRQINDFTIRQFTDQSHDYLTRPLILFVCDAHRMEIRTEDGRENLQKCDLLCLFAL
jgi:hypothetical protein